MLAPIAQFACAQTTRRSQFYLYGTELQQKLSYDKIPSNENQVSDLLNMPI